MTLYADMQSRIALELRRSDLTAQTQNAIKDAIKFYESKDFFFNEARSTLDTVNEQEYYGMPSDFQRANTIKIFPTTNNSYMLNVRQWQWMEEKRSNSQLFGYPTDFCIYAKQLRLYPIPNGVYRLEFAYNKQLDDISATAGADNDWLSEGEMVIRTRAKIDILENVIRSDSAIKEANILKGREFQESQRLIAETCARRATGRLRPVKF